MNLDNQWLVLLVRSSVVQKAEGKHCNFLLACIYQEALCIICKPPVYCYSIQIIPHIIKIKMLAAHNVSA